MKHNQFQTANPRINQALNELASLVSRKYPTATFEVISAEDDPAIIHLLALVDIEDPEDVANLVMDRMIQMQVEEGLPVYLIPLRTPERISAMRKAQKHSRPQSEYFPPSDVSIPPIH